MLIKIFLTNTILVIIIFKPSKIGGIKVEENLKSIGEDILKIEKLIAKCDECGLKECIQCEVCWDEVQSIKHLLSEYKKKQKEY